VLALAGEHGDAAYYALIRAKFGLDARFQSMLLVYGVRVLHATSGSPTCTAGR